MAGLSPTTTRSGAIIARGMIGSARPCSPRRCGPRRRHSTRRACSIPAFSLTHDVQPSSRSLPSVDQSQSWVIFTWVLIDGDGGLPLDSFYAGRMHDTEGVGQNLPPAPSDNIGNRYRLL